MHKKPREIEKFVMNEFGTKISAVKPGIMDKVIKIDSIFGK